uniref:hypothetical protein n=1 Tax=Desulfoluna sp. TaxID=2045199 RepID=UPI002628FC95
PLKTELMMRLILPFRFFGRGYFIGVLMGRDRTDPPPHGIHSMGGRIATMAILALLLFIVISGIFFILYLIKSLIGIDLFSNAHLME